MYVLMGAILCSSQDNSYECIKSSRFWPVKITPLLTNISNLEIAQSYIMSTVTLPLYVCTYNRGTYPNGVKKPYHWSFLIITGPGPNQGVAHQVHGMPGGFYYNGPEPVGDYTKSTTKVDIVEIGAIPIASLPLVKGVLDTVVIVKDEASDWNCQDWSKEAFAQMKAKGWVYQDFDAIKNWLKE